MPFQRFHLLSAKSAAHYLEFECRGGPLVGGAGMVREVAAYALSHLAPTGSRGRFDGHGPPHQPDYLFVPLFQS